MYVYFDVDERTFLRLRRSVQEGQVEAGKLSVAIGLTDEEGFPHRGMLDFTDNRVDPETGTLRFRAVVLNKDRVLVPGLFVRVRLALSAPHKALLVSDRAILSDQGLKCVYVLGSDNKLEQRRVTTGSLEADGLRVISEGLKPEDRVVSGGLQGLRPGITVRPKEEAMPGPKPPQALQRAPSARGQVERRPGQ
jgi:RND family efflux transporter MFP subunit